ncbi:hypothetical protein CHARACLAT_028467 [Characodon lateralis]|uniref:Uncharacterized protein n=1 Tax=Characodon lateralis TaxID=208331 RepID=A0ABU7D1G7_9TELE|nr:hypothetical protein [Characodon lateralis]
MPLSTLGRRSLNVTSGFSATDDQCSADVQLSFLTRGPVGESHLRGSPQPAPQWDKMDSQTAGELPVQRASRRTSSWHASL